MFSFVATFVTALPEWLLSHPTALAGYAIAVLFPIPYLNSAVIAMWAAAKVMILDKLRGTITTVIPAQVVVVPKSTVAAAPVK